MPQTEFENINLRRAYPFLDHKHPQLFPWVTDLSLTLRPAAKYQHGTHRVGLLLAGTMNDTQAGLLGTGDHRRFFALFATSPGLRYEYLLFTVPPDAAVYDEIHGTAVAAYTLISVLFGVTPQNPPPPADNIDKWEGWLRLGELTDLPPTPQRLSPPLQVEPARITNSAEVSPRVGRTYVYNQVRTQYTHPGGCSPPPTPAELQSGQYLLACGPIEGEFRIAGGHATQISQNPPQRQFTVTADGSAGELGYACEPVPVVGDVDDTDTSPRCDEVLRSINGVSGPSVRITPLASAQIGRYPELHRVVIALSGIDAANCPAVPEPVPVEHLPTDANNVPCGDNGQPLPPPPGPPDNGPGYKLAGGSPLMMMKTSPVIAPVTTPSGCVWVAAAGQWEFQHGDCSSPAGCLPPDGPPKNDGDTQTTPCVALADTYGTYVRNPDFLAVPRLNGWDVVGDVIVLDEDDLQLGASGPLVRLHGGVLGASLSQRQITIDPNRDYILQFDCRVLHGDAEVAIGTEFGFHQAAKVSLTAATHGSWQEVLIDSLRYSVGPLRLVVTTSPGAVLDISNFALVRQ